MCALKRSHPLGDMKRYSIIFNSCAWVRKGWLWVGSNSHEIKSNFAALKGMWLAVVENSPFNSSKNFTKAKTGAWLVNMNPYLCGHGELTPFLDRITE